MSDDYRTLQERLDGRDLSDLEQRIRSARSSAELGEILTASQEFTGTFRRQADGSTVYSNEPAQTVPSTPSTERPAVKPVADDGMLRSVWELPDGTIKIVEAFSVTGLDTINASFANWKGCTRIR